MSNVWAMHYQSCMRTQSLHVASYDESVNMFALVCRRRRNAHGSIIFKRVVIRLTEHKSATLITIFRSSRHFLGIGTAGYVSKLRAEDLAYIPVSRGAGLIRYQKWGIFLRHWLMITKE